MKEVIKRDVSGYKLPAPDIFCINCSKYPCNPYCKEFNFAEYGCINYKDSSDD